MCGRQTALTELSVALIHHPVRSLTPASKEEGRTRPDPDRRPPCGTAEEDHQGINRPDLRLGSMPVVVTEVGECQDMMNARMNGIVSSREVSTK
eukprot:757443-Hanusia_phi.AAC.1